MKMDKLKILGAASFVLFMLWYGRCHSPVEGSSGQADHIFFEQEV